MHETVFPFLTTAPSDLLSEIIVVTNTPDVIVPPTDTASRFRIIQGCAGRGAKLKSGAELAANDWLLFLHADTELIGPWEMVVRQHISLPRNIPAVFKLSYDSPGVASKLVGEWGTKRTQIFGVPYGDQGLLISRAQYKDIGGYREDFPLMEDVEIMQRIGGKGYFKLLNASTRTSSEKYISEGWFKRGAKHWWIYFLYRRGASPKELYEKYYR